MFSYQKIIKIWKSCTLSLKNNYHLRIIIIRSACLYKQAYVLLTYSVFTRLETVLPKCYRRWRRRIRRSVYRMIWKYSPPPRPADVRISRRGSTVIQRAVRKSRIFQRRRQQRNRSPRCRRYQNLSRSQWRWIFVATGTRINRMKSRRSRSFLRMRTSKADRCPRRRNGAPEASRATYAVGNSALPAFLYMNLNAWR